VTTETKPTTGRNPAKEGNRKAAAGDDRARFVSDAHAVHEELRNVQRTAADLYYAITGARFNEVPRRVGERLNVAAAIDAVLKPIADRMKAGCNSEAVAGIVAQWSMPFADHVRPATIGAKGKHYAGALIVHCDHAVYRQELRPRLPALRAELAKLGIAEVILR
jgi:hypothetical protein